MPVASKFDPQQLHVIAAISNPKRFESRYRLYNQFAAEMKTAGANLLTVEAAFGDRVHEVTPPIHGKHIQVRGSQEIWLKERLMEIGVQQLPDSAKYIAFVDADISFLNPNWQTETIEALQHWPVIQMHEAAIDMGPTGTPIATYQGFAASWAKGLPLGVNAGGGYYGTLWHPGFTLAMTRDAYDSLGGLVSQAILGAGDHHLNLALIGKAEYSLPGGITKGYHDMVMEYQERATQDRIVGNIGYAPGTIVHHWHGKKSFRRYQERWQIIQKHGFDPAKDIKLNAQGLWQLTAAGERMRSDLRRYFFERDEDSIDND
jgi:hypothetical protein